MLRGMGNIGGLNRGPEGPENGITLITNGHDVNMYANVSFPLAPWISLQNVPRERQMRCTGLHQPISIAFQS